MYHRRHSWRDNRAYNSAVPPVVFSSPTPKDPKAESLARDKDKAYDEFGKAIENLLKSALAEEFYRATVMAKAYGRPEPIPERMEMLSDCKAVAFEHLSTLGLLAETLLFKTVDGYLYPPQTFVDEKDKEHEVESLEPPPNFKRIEVANSVKKAAIKSGAKKSRRTAGGKATTGVDEG